jgi:predicted regulator of Ras-like GTPase activity (Roadblock/LC7/MglB family)
MDVVQALSDLTEASSQIDAAVLVGDDGEALGSTLADADSAKRVADAGTALLQAAEQGPAGSGRAALTDVVATVAAGAVVCSRAAGRTIVAVTVPDPTIGLVLYDLRATLRAAAETSKPKPKPRPRPRKKAGDA